jgi:hypothetical protein
VSGQANPRQPVTHCGRLAARMRQTGSTAPRTAGRDSHPGAPGLHMTRAGLLRAARQQAPAQRGAGPACRLLPRVPAHAVVDGLGLRGQGPPFATLAAGPGAVAQSGSAPRSHRGGQGFESPQLHLGLPTELPVSYRQNCDGDLVLIVAAWSDSSVLCGCEPGLPLLRAGWLGWPSAGRLPGVAGGLAVALGPSGVLSGPAGGRGGWFGGVWCVVWLRRFAAGW